MRLRETQTTATVYSSGSMVCFGRSMSEEESRRAARMHARSIQKLGYPVRFLNFAIHNIQGTCDVNFRIRLEKLLVAPHNQFTSYEPELGISGVLYRMVKPRIILHIFVSGKISLTGTKSTSEMLQAIENIYPILQNSRITDN